MANLACQWVFLLGESRNIQANIGAFHSKSTLESGEEEEMADDIVLVFMFVCLFSRYNIWNNLYILAKITISLFLSLL